MLTRINERSSGNAPDNKGLGLAISKEIVRQMGGNLEINSEVGSGTTVYITIPCHAETIRRRRMIYNI